MWLTLTTLIGSLLLLITPILTLIGLFKPELLSKIIRFKSFVSRKQVLKEGILAFVSSFVVTGFAASNAPKPANKQVESAPTSSQVIAPTNPTPSPVTSVVSTEEVPVTPKPSPSALPTIKPTPSIQPTIKPTPKPTSIATPKPVVKTVTPQVTTSGSWSCDCSKTCPNMSCAEAQYQLNTCECKKRDGDGDGVACDSQCQ